MKSGASEGRMRIRERGLTVLEVMIVLAAIGLVVLITVPTSGMFLEKYRLSTASGRLSSSLEMARSEAHVRGSTVRVCPSSNGETCRTDGNWNLGWLVFSDGNADGRAQDIERIRAYDAPHQQVSIRAEGAALTRVSFTMNGLVGEHGADSGSFRICYLQSDHDPTAVTIDADGWVVKGPAQGQACQQG